MRGTVVRIKLKDGAVTLLGEGKIAGAQRGSGLLQSGVKRSGAGWLRTQTNDTGQHENRHERCNAQSTKQNKYPEWSLHRTGTEKPALFLRVENNVHAGDCKTVNSAEAAARE